MHQEHKPIFGEVQNANTRGVQGCSDALTGPSDPAITLAKLEWMGPRAFMARYGAQLSSRLRLEPPR